MRDRGRGKERLSGDSMLSAVTNYKEVSFPNRFIACTKILIFFFFVLESYSLDYPRISQAVILKV